MTNAVLQRPAPASAPARPAPRPRSWRPLTWLLLLVAGLASLAFSPWGQAQIQALQQACAGQPEAESAGAAAASPSYIVCLGYVDSESGVIALSPIQAGRVVEVLVKENDEVPAGAPLVRLDDATAALGVREAKAALATSKAHLAKARQAKELHGLKITCQQAAVEAAGFKVAAAKHSLKARQHDLEIKSIGKNQQDPIMLAEVAAYREQIKELAALETTEKEKLKDLQRQDPGIDMELADAEVQKMEVKLLQAQQILAEHTLTAPVAGKILRVLVAQGELLGAADKRIAIQFCPRGALIIRAEVDQAYAQSVAAGDPVRIEDDIHPEMNWKGKVKSVSTWYTQKRLIAQEKFQLKDARTLECLIAPDDEQCPLLIGQRVRITVQPKQ